jgi:hypothetical protein
MAKKKAAEPTVEASGKPGKPEDLGPRMLKVAPGMYVHLPTKIVARERGWMSPGDVVDATDPFIYWQCLEGQRHKFVEAPEGAVANVKPHPRIETLRRESAKASGEKVQEESAKATAARARAKKVTSKIPDPDAAPVEVETD